MLSKLTPIKAFFAGVGTTLLSLIVASIITYLFVPHKGESTRFALGTTVIAFLIIIIVFGLDLLLRKVHAKVHAIE